MTEKRPSHDGYFKFGLSLEEIQQSVIKHLPPEHVARMDLSDIRIESESLVGRQLNRKVVDVLLSVAYTDHRCLVYILIEHLSTVPKMMPLRFMCYVLYVLERWVATQNELKRNGKLHLKGPLKLPTIFPIIYYNGEAAYHGPLTLAELFEDPETFTQTFNGPMKVIDTGEMDTARFEEEATAYVFHSLMKNIFSPELKQILLDLRPYLRQIEIESDGVDFIVRSFKYIVDSARGTKQEDLIEVIESLSSSRGEVMTIMETWTTQISEYKATIAEMEHEKAEIEQRAERKQAEIEQRAKREKAEIEQRAERKQAEIEQRTALTMERSVCMMLAQGMDESIIANGLDVPVSLVQRIKAELA